MAIELLEVHGNQLEEKGFEQEELETLLEYLCVSCHPRHLSSLPSILLQWFPWGAPVPHKVKLG